MLHAVHHSGFFREHDFTPDYMFACTNKVTVRKNTLKLFVLFLFNVASISVFPILLPKMSPSNMCDA